MIFTNKKFTLDNSEQLIKKSVNKKKILHWAKQKFLLVNVNKGTFFGG